MNIISNEIQTKKDEIATRMFLKGQKTIDLDIAKVQMKTTKSVKIFDKPGLIDFLRNIENGIEEGVKTFALPFVRKLVDTKVISSKIATFEENRTVYITATEPDKT